MLALNRLYAVCMPFWFTPSAKQSLWIIGTIFFISPMGGIGLTFLHLFNCINVIITNSLYISEIFICFFFFKSISYLLMVLKLHRQKRKIALATVNATIYCSNKTRNVEGTAKEATVTRQSEQINEFGIRKIRAKPIKTVAIFGVITVIFLLKLFQACFSFQLTNYYYVLYILFFNNNTNFLINIIFNTEFRKQVNEFGQ